MNSPYEDPYMQQGWMDWNSEHVCFTQQDFDKSPPAFGLDGSETLEQIGYQQTGTSKQLFVEHYGVLPDEYGLSPCSDFPAEYTFSETYPGLDSSYGPVPSVPSMLFGTGSFTPPGSHHDHYVPQQDPRSLAAPNDFAGSTSRGRATDPDPPTSATPRADSIPDPVLPDPPSKRRSDPPQGSGHPQALRQSPRFDGDEYTAAWVRGEGCEREGWCGTCASWHKLKDSAYWYHLQFAHGINCASGRPFDPPQAWRNAAGSAGYEVLCGGCARWVYVGRWERWRTPYFRHAYKCQTKHRLGVDRSRSRGTRGSPLGKAGAAVRK